LETPLFRGRKATTFMISSRFSLMAAVVIAGSVGGCDRTPSGELSTWKPTDHDGEKGASATQGARGDAGGPGVLVEATWRSQCASCHGNEGKGDGPQGPMFKAADLTRADWQAKVTDDQIGAAIAQGKGRMPRFDLPPEIVRGLVARVRSMRGR
jgi:mono/diheme cytochrome c family protein